MQLEDRQSRTQQVLEKWGVEGKMNDEDIRNAASSFARIRIKNSIMKKVAVGGVLFIATFIGLMLGSVILGIEATKDFKVREQVLVQNNGTALGTAEAFYAVNLKLTTPLSTIKGIKSLKFNRGKEGTLQINVVSFYFIPGRTLTLYGVNHVVEVLADGTVEVSPITTSNGARSVDEEKRNSFTEVSATGSLNTVTNVLTDINQCADLLLIQETGKYQLTNNLNCTLLKPLLSLPGQSFRGTINGNGHYLSINLNTTGVAALFRTLKQATIINLLLKGNITGTQNCGGFAVETYPGTSFISSGVYANIECSNDGNTRTVIGGFSALLRNENNDQSIILWSESVSQSHFNLLLSDLSLLNFQGGFYGAAIESVVTNFNFSYSASTPNQHGGNYRLDRFGYKVVPHSDESSHTDKKSHVYLPENCYNWNKTSPAYINMCVEFYREYLYEETCCCASVCFDSCPYINCSAQSKVCMQCRRTHRKKEKEEQEESTSSDNTSSSSPDNDPALIIPTVKPFCLSN